MRNVLSTVHHLLIVGLLAGFAGLADAQANTSAEEVLKDMAAEDITVSADVTEDVTEEEAETTEGAEVVTSDETEPTAQVSEPDPNDYGDDVLNALYHE